MRWKKGHTDLSQGAAACVKPANPKVWQSHTITQTPQAKQPESACVRVCSGTGEGFPDTSEWLLEAFVLSVLTRVISGFWTNAG